LRKIYIDRSFNLLLPSIDLLFKSHPLSRMTIPTIHVPIDTPPRAPSPAHGFGTLAVHAGSPHDPVTGAVIEAVSLIKRAF
jgi:hypothetical protein